MPIEAAMSVLVREAPRRREIRVPRPCDTWRVRGAHRTLLPSPGRARRHRLVIALMVLCGVAIMLGVSALTAGRDLCGSCIRGCTKARTTGYQLAQYAYEGYPAW